MFSGKSYTQFKQNEIANLKAAHKQGKLDRLLHEKLSTGALIDFAKDDEVLLTEKQANHIIQILISNNLSQEILSLSLLKEHFALALLKNIHNWQSYVEQPEQFIKKICSKFPSVDNYVNSKKDLSALKKMNDIPVQTTTTTYSSAFLPDYDYMYKINLRGDSGVGKSSLLLRFAENSFTESYISTIGVDFKIKTIEVDGKTIKLQIWDSCGQERFRTCSDSEKMHGSHAVLLVFDLTDRMSFQNIDIWLQGLDRYFYDIPTLVLVGAKSDLKTKRVIERTEAMDFANYHNMAYIETSAKIGNNVDHLFFQTAKIISMQRTGKYHNISQGQSETTFAIPTTLDGINREFIRIFEERRMTPSQALTAQLQQLRSAALNLIKEEKENEANQRTYLQSVGDLWVINKHIYNGKLALVKNVGRTNAKILIDEWIHLAVRQYQPQG